MTQWWDNVRQGVSSSLTAAREVVRRLLHGGADREATLEEVLHRWRPHTPAPVLWLIGKTQSGKTSVIRYLTGAADAAIGQGFRPTTRTTRRYDFPNADAPLIAFLDTRGLDEPGYDPSADIAACAAVAHGIIVTVKLTDPAQGTIRGLLQAVRRHPPSLPTVLCLTCLHEASPGQPLPQPYPFGPWRPDALPTPQELHAAAPALAPLIQQQLHAFAGLYDLAVAVDLTRPEDGLADPHYGGPTLKQALLDVLPHAYRQTLLRLDALGQELKEWHLRQALPVILGYSTLAGAVGALPIPLVDLPLLFGLHLRMAREVARIYHQLLTFDNYRQLATVLGTGLVVRQLARQAAKLVPVVGSALGGAAAFAATYALGRALCYYFQAVHAGHVPDAATLRRVYDEQIAAAEKLFRQG